MKMKLVAFFEDLGFVDNVSSSGMVPKKQKKWFIETWLLVEFDTKEDMKTIFGE